MKTIGAQAAKDYFSSVLSACRKEPIVIEQDGTPVAVVVSPEDFQLLQALEQDEVARCNSAPAATVEA
jgi:prevent-host-death family protein